MAKPANTVTTMERITISAVVGPSATISPQRDPQAEQRHRDAQESLHGEAHSRLEKRTRGERVQRDADQQRDDHGRQGQQIRQARRQPDRDHRHGERERQSGPVGGDERARVAPCSMRLDKRNMPLRQSSRRDNRAQTLFRVTPRRALSRQAG